MAQENGTAQPSFVTTQLDALAREGVATQDDLEDIRGISSVIYAGVHHLYNSSNSADHIVLAGMETVRFFLVHACPLIDCDNRHGRLSWCSFMQ